MSPPERWHQSVIIAAAIFIALVAVTYVGWKVFDEPSSTIPGDAAGGDEKQ